MNAVSFEDRLRQLDIVFVIDATGSMDSCIRQVQERLNYLAQAIAGAPARPDVAFGAVAYRDHPPQDPTFVTRVFPVTRSLAEAQKTVNSIEANGGSLDTAHTRETPSAISASRAASHRVCHASGGTNVLLQAKPCTHATWSASGQASSAACVRSWRSAICSDTGRPTHRAGASQPTWM